MLWRYKSGLNVSGLMELRVVSEGFSEEATCEPSLLIYPFVPRPYIYAKLGKP